MPDQLLTKDVPARLPRAKVRLDDVAQAAYVSVATVSRALNDSPSVNRLTKQRIWNIAVELGYVDPGQTQHAFAGAEFTVGIFITSPAPGDLTTLPFYQEIIASLALAARDNGCNLLLVHANPKDAPDLARLIESNGCDGAIFIGQSTMHDRFNRLADAFPNFVVWGQQMPGQRYRSVGSDNLAGGRRATEHLLNLGRRRIAYFGETDGPEVRLRFQGYLDALQAFGIAYAPDLVVSTECTSDGAEQTMRTFLARDIAFDAVFAASDIMAVGLMHALHQAGVSIPGQVAIVGYDNSQVAALTYPTLSTVSQDLEHAGALLLSSLLGASGARDALTDLVSTQVIVRASCGGA